MELLWDFCSLKGKTIKECFHLGLVYCIGSLEEHLIYETKFRVRSQDAVWNIKKILCMIRLLVLAAKVENLGKVGCLGAEAMWRVGA